MRGGKGFSLISQPSWAPASCGVGGQMLSPLRSPPGVRSWSCCPCCPPTHSPGDTGKVGRATLPAGHWHAAWPSIRSQLPGCHTYPHRSGSCPAGSPCLSSAAGSEKHTQASRYCPGGAWAGKAPRSPPQAGSRGPGGGDSPMPPAPSLLPTELEPQLALGGQQQALRDKPSRAGGHLRSPR